MAEIGAQGPHVPQDGLRIKFPQVSKGPKPAKVWRKSCSRGPGTSRIAVTELAHVSVTKTTCALRRRRLRDLLVGPSNEKVMNRHHGTMAAADRDSRSNAARSSVKRDEGGSCQICPCGSSGQSSVRAVATQEQCFRNAADLSRPAKSEQRVIGLPG